MLFPNQFTFAALFAVLFYASVADSTNGTLLQDSADSLSLAKSACVDSNFASFNLSWLQTILTEKFAWNLWDFPLYPLTQGRDNTGISRKLSELCESLAHVNQCVAERTLWTASHSNSTYSRNMKILTVIICDPANINVVSDNFQCFNQLKETMAAKTQADDCQNNNVTVRSQLKVVESKFYNKSNPKIAEFCSNDVKSDCVSAMVRERCGNDQAATFYKQLQMATLQWQFLDILDINVCYCSQEYGIVMKATRESGYKDIHPCVDSLSNYDQCLSSLPNVTNIPYLPLRNRNSVSGNQLDLDTTDANDVRSTISDVCQSIFESADCIKHVQYRPSNRYNDSTKLDICQRCFDLRICTNRKTAYIGICNAPAVITKQTAINRALQSALCDQKSVDVQIENYKCFSSMAKSGAFDAQEKECQSSPAVKKVDADISKSSSNDPPGRVSYCHAKLMSDCVYSIAAAKCGGREAVETFSRIELSMSLGEDTTLHSYSCPSYFDIAEVNANSIKQDQPLSNGDESGHNVYSNMFSKVLSLFYRKAK